MHSGGDINITNAYSYNSVSTADIDTAGALIINAYNSGISTGNIGSHIASASVSLNAFDGLYTGNINTINNIYLGVNYRLVTGNLQSSAGSIYLSSGTTISAGDLNALTGINLYAGSQGYGQGSSYITAGNIHNSGALSIDNGGSDYIALGDIYNDNTAGFSISNNFALTTGAIHATGDVSLYSNNDYLTTGNIYTTGNVSLDSFYGTSTGVINTNGDVSVSGYYFSNLGGVSNANNVTVYSSGHDVSSGAIDAHGNFSISGYNVYVGGNIGTSLAPSSVIVSSNGGGIGFYNSSITTSGGGIYASSNEGISMYGNISLTDTNGGTISLYGGNSGILGSGTANLGIATAGNVSVNDIGINSSFDTVSITSGNSLSLPSITANTIFARTTGANSDLSIDGILNATGGGSGDITLVAKRNFINGVGTSALQTNGGTYLIYSTNAAGDSFNGLTSNFHRYSCTYDGSCPTLSSGNGFLYTYAPTLTLSANSQAVTYGDAAPAYTYGLSGYLSGDSGIDALSASGGSIFASSYAQGSNAGVYNITHSTGTLASALGYGFIYSGLNNGLTVGKKSITASFNAPVEKTYGDANPTVDYHNFTFANLYGSDSASLFSATPNFGVIGANTNAGTYANAISASFNAANYSITNTPTTNLVINKRNLTVTTDPKSKTYGAAEPTFTGTITGLTNYDATTEGVSFTYAPSGYTGNAGSYTISSTANDANSRLGNYNVTDNYGTFTVNQALLNIASNNKTKTYGDANPTYDATFTGFTNGDTDSSVTGLHFIGPAVNSNVGSYAITGSGATNSNYIISYTNGNLTITSKSLTAGLTGTVGKTYDGTSAATLASNNYTLSGIINSDEVNLTNYTSGTYNNKNAGSGKSVSVSGLGLSGSGSGNYILASNSASGNAGTILTRSLVIGASGTNKTYDGNTTGTVTLSDNRIAGDSLNDTYSSATFSDKNAANGKAVNISGISISGTDANNYSYNTTASTTANIAAKGLTVTANSGQHKTYGDVDPALTYSYSGLVGGDSSASFIGTVSRNIGSNAGTYAINQGNLSATGNYTIGSYTSNNFTINKAALSITADNKTRFYGDNNNLSATYSGLVNGDNSSVVNGLNFSTVADNNSSIGTYNITLTGGTAINYIITDHNGAITVNPATLTVTPDSFIRYFGEMNPVPLTGSITGFKNGQNNTILTSQPVYSTYATNSSPIGNYTVTASGAGVNSNYLINYLTGTIEIDPIPGLSQIIIPNTVTQVSQNPSINRDPNSPSSSHSSTNNDSNATNQENANSSSNSNSYITRPNQTSLNSESKEAGPALFRTYLNGLLYIDPKLSWINNI